MIVDTSALVAIITNEKEANRCKTALLAARSPQMSAANMLEAFTVVDRIDNQAAPSDLELLLLDSAMRIEPVTEAQVYVARDAIARFGRGRHRAKLNFGDGFAYALARETGEPLLFGGNDFGQTDIA